MPRTLLINLHLYVAAVLAPILLMMAVSGGLYLLGYKGEVSQTAVSTPAEAQLNLDSGSLQQDVAQLLAAAGVSHEFEYIKRKGNVLYTRPTSREHYQITHHGDTLSIMRNEPSTQSTLIELHKGHGPQAFKTFQKVTAAGLLFIVLSGVWLGLSSSRLRMPTVLSSAAGLFVFLLLGFF